MIRSTLLLFLAIHSIIAIAQEHTIYIEKSILALDEYETYRGEYIDYFQDLDPNLSSEEIEELVVDYLGVYGEAYIFRDSNVINAFPETRNKIGSISICSSSMIFGNNTHIEIKLEPKATTTNIATTTCSHVDEGLMCSNLSITEKSYISRPENTFELLNGVTYEEATDIFRALILRYENSTSKPSFYNDIKVIGRNETGYYLKYGNIYCGCLGEVNVINNIDSNGNKILKISDEITLTCA